MMKLFFILIISLLTLVAGPLAQAQCVRLLEDGKVRSVPDREMLEFKKGDIFKIIKISPDWQQIYAEKDLFKVVLKKSQVAEEKCYEVKIGAEKPKPAPPPPPLTKFLRWGFEYQHLMNVSASQFEDLVTAIPNKADVSPLQDPLITEIKRGTGSMMRLTLDYAYTDQIQLDSFLGLKKLTFKYLQKNNPSLSPVGYDELSTTEKSFQLTQYVLGFGGKYFFAESENEFKYYTGAQLQLQYSKETEVKIDALVGNLFKNTPSSVSTKIEQLSIDVLLQAGTQRDWFNASIGLTPSMAYVIAIGGRFSF